MRNFATFTVIAIIFLVLAFTLMSKRITNRQRITAAQETMHEQDDIQHALRSDAPRITAAADSQTLLDVVLNAPPPDNQGSIGNSRARKALGILAERKDAEAFEIILKSARDCPDAPMCNAAIDILSHRWRDERAIGPLTASASRGYVKAATALGSFYMPQSRDALIPLMQHTNSEIRTEAAKYLARGLHKDSAVMSAAENALATGTVEVADAFWMYFLGPRYKNVILAAFDRHPLSDAFSALGSTIYIHGNNITTEESLIIIRGPDEGKKVAEMKRKRLERLLDDPEHYNFTR